VAMHERWDLGTGGDTPTLATSQPSVSWTTDLVGLHT